MGRRGGCPGSLRRGSRLTAQPHARRGEPMDSAGRDPRVPAGRAGAAVGHGGGGPRRPGARPGRRPGSGAARRPRTGWLAAHPVIGHAVLLICYLAAGVAVTWPRASYLAGQLPSSRDSASYVWGFWWMARQVSHLGNPWFTNHMAAPAGVFLGFHALMPLPGLIMTPVTLAFGPSASYNLLVIVVPGLLCYAMYRAARLWLTTQPGAIAAGAFFGLSAMLGQEDWYHLNIAAGALFLPITLELSVRLRRSPGLRLAAGLGVALGAAVLTDSESAILAAILTRSGAAAMAAPPSLGSKAVAGGSRGRGRGGRGQPSAHRDGAGTGPRWPGHQGTTAGRDHQAVRDRPARDVLADAPGSRLRAHHPGLAVPAQPGQRAGADVRRDPDGAGPGRAGGGVAAARLPAAGPAVAGLRRARPRRHAVDRRSPVHPVRPDVERGGGLPGPPLHMVRADPRAVLRSGRRTGGPSWAWYPPPCWPARQWTGCVFTPGRSSRW